MVSLLFKCLMSHPHHLFLIGSFFLSSHFVLSVYLAPFSLYLFLWFLSSLHFCLFCSQFISFKIFTVFVFFFCFLESLSLLSFFHLHDSSSFLKFSLSSIVCCVQFLLLLSQLCCIFPSIPNAVTAVAFSLFPSDCNVSHVFAPIRFNVAALCAEQL